MWVRFPQGTFIVSGNDDKSLLLFSCKNSIFGDRFVSEKQNTRMILSEGKPAMILATTILFYIVCIFAGIYGHVVVFVNFIAMVGVIMFLFSLDWLQLGIALSILVVSYLMLYAWGVVILFIAKIREVFTDILIA